MNIAWKLPLGLGLLSCIAVPASAEDASSKWGTGDWGGVRSELLE